MRCLPTVSSLPSDLDSQIHFINMMLGSLVDSVCYLLSKETRSIPARNSHSYYWYGDQTFGFSSNFFVVHPKRATRELVILGGSYLL